MRAPSEEPAEVDQLGFASALLTLLGVRGLNQQDLARLSGFSSSAVSLWVSGKVGELRPSTVFALERALEVPGGMLSRYFGYEPTQGQARVGVVEALLADPLLWPEAREVMLAQYRAFVSIGEGRHAR